MGDPVADRYWLVARDKPALLIRMMRELASEDAWISFEGDLSGCRFPETIRAFHEPNLSLSRHTSCPVQDFIALSLAPETIRPVLDVVLRDNRYLRQIIHIQIARAGVLQFGSYDQFHPECIVAFPPSISAELLDQLLASGVIRSWTVPHAGAQRWHG